MTLVMGSLQLGLIYGMLAVGVYIAFRVLGIPDLSAEGTFTFGLAVSAALTVAGHPLLGVLLGFLAGCLGGAVTGVLQTKLQIHPILAGILTMSGLYSVNLAVMGSSSNLSLVGLDTLFRMSFDLFSSMDKEIVKLLLPALFCLVLVVLLALFFKTHEGLCIRATGDNEEMVRASSINVDVIKILALSISNGCIGLSGAVLAQYQRSADINLGTGMVVIGLASLIIGETLFGRGGMWVKAVAAVAGSVIYRFIIALALRANVPSECLKLISAVIVALAIAAPALKAKADFRRRRANAQKGGARHA